MNDDLEVWRSEPDGMFHEIFQYVFVFENGEIIYIAGYEWGFHGDLKQIYGRYSDIYI